MLLSPKVLTRLSKIFEVSPSLDINLNSFSTNFPIQGVPKKLPTFQMKEVSNVRQKTSVLMFSEC